MGQWMRNGATDNPRFLSVLIGDWLNNWKLTTSNQNTGTPEAQLVDADPGRYTFATQCSACHTIGHGDKIGPDLQGVAEVRDPKWLARFIQTPEKMVAEGDPIATALFEKYRQIRMPNLRISDEDTALLIDFLKRQSKDPEGKLAHAQSSTPQNQEIGLHHSESHQMSDSAAPSAGVSSTVPKARN